MYPIPIESEQLNNNNLQITKESNFKWAFVISNNSYKISSQKGFLKQNAANIS